MKLQIALVALALASISMVGCENRPSGPPPSGGGVHVDAGPAHVDTGPGGVDVDVNRRDGAGKAVDVDVAPGGGVDVEVNRDAIRERREERREERELELATK